MGPLTDGRGYYWYEYGNGQYAVPIVLSYWIRYVAGMVWILYKLILDVLYWI